MKADEILTRGADHIRDRAATRDMPEGERSMKRCVEAFNAQEGTSLTEAQGWRFMIQLKYARATAGKFNIDDYEDMSAYSALAAECEANENEQRQEMQIFNARMVLRAKDMQDRQDARRQVSADLMP